MSALALSVESNANDRTPQLRKVYEDCVLRAVRSHNANPRFTGDTSEATELAFQVCQSEERAIIAHLYAAGVTQITAEKALYAFKLRLRRTIRKAPED
jgi:hypothetical protein